MWLIVDSKLQKHLAIGIEPKNVTLPLLQLLNGVVRGGGGGGS